MQQQHMVNIPNILVDGYMWSDMLTNLTREKFPHTDMVKLEEGVYEIHLSLAGYDKKNIKIALENNILTVEGDWPGEDTFSPSQYLMHGIAKRKFKRMFPLAEHIEVNKVKMENGILVIELARNVTVELLPKQFLIE